MQNGKTKELSKGAKKFFDKYLEVIEKGESRPVATDIYQQLHPYVQRNTAASMSCKFLREIRANEEFVEQLERAVGVAREQREQKFAELIHARRTTEIRASDGTLLGYNDSPDYQVQAVSMRLLSDVKGDLPKQGRRGSDGQETRSLTFSEAFAEDKRLIEEEKKKQIENPKDGNEDKS